MPFQLTLSCYLQLVNAKNFYTYILQAYSKVSISYHTMLSKVTYNLSSGKQPRIMENTSRCILCITATTVPAKK